MKLIGCLVFSALVLMAGCAGDDACEVWHYDLAHQPAEEAVAEGLDAQHGLYVATLEIGTPAQEVDAIIDTDPGVLSARDGLKRAQQTAAVTGVSGVDVSRLRPVWIFMAILRNRLTFPYAPFWHSTDLRVRAVCS